MTDHSTLPAKVLDQAYVAETAWVLDGAAVAGTARITGKAWIDMGARVHGNAWVFENAYVSGNASIFGNASVFGFAVVSDRSQIFDDAYVFGTAAILDEAKIYGDAKIVIGKIDADAEISCSGDLTQIVIDDCVYSWFPVRSGGHRLTCCHVDGVELSEADWPVPKEEMVDIIARIVLASSH